MRLKYYVLICVLLYLFTGTQAHAKENKITIIYEGQLFEVTGTLSDGVTSVAYEEMLHIVSHNKPSDYKYPKDNKSIITVREFAKDYRLEVYWEEKTSTIIMTKEINTVTISEKDILLISKMLSHDWLKCNTKEKVYQYFADFLSLPLCKEVTENVWEFIEQGTDWNATYNLESFAIVAGGSDWKIGLATILEEGIWYDTKKGYGLFVLSQSDTKEWIISGMKYYWP